MLGKAEDGALREVRHLKKKEDRDGKANQSTPPKCQGSKRKKASSSRDNTNLNGKRRKEGRQTLGRAVHGGWGASQWGYCVGQKGCIKEKEKKPERDKNSPTDLVR